MTDRRTFLALAAAAAVARQVDLDLPGGPSTRPLTRAFPQKGEMILQRTSPPLLETPISVFNDGIFTPNDRFFVRWHWADIPTTIDPAKFRLAITGHVTRPQSLGLADLARLPRFEIAAVNQCAGNSRGLFEPRVAGAQWRHGAMGNARWTGVALRDVLDAAGVRPGATHARFGGMDRATGDGAPDFEKSLTLDHARDGEVMLAFAMNGAPLPLLNGFPLRLVVPGWYSTYWIKMLDSIEILAAPDTGYWMDKAYRVPANPAADIVPGATGFATAPITRMIPRAFITSHADGATLPSAPTLTIGGIAMGGDHGVARVEVSGDGGRRWTPASLGPDAGRYGFRRFTATVAANPGSATLLARCTSTAGLTQPATANWNPGGYARGVIEAIRVTLT